MEGSSNEWLGEAMDHVLRNGTGKPLACYVFSPNSKFINRVNDRIDAGAVVANDVIYHMVLEEVPFGGTGESGCGCYGFDSTFKTFSHAKPLAIRSAGREFLNKDRYPNPKADEMKQMKVGIIHK